MLLNSKKSIRQSDSSVSTVYSNRGIDQGAVHSSSQKDNAYCLKSSVLFLLAFACVSVVFGVFVVGNMLVTFEIQPMTLLRVYMVAAVFLHFVLLQLDNNDE